MQSRLIAKTELMERGWTEALIKAFQLKPVVTRENPRHNGEKYRIKLYEFDQVVQLEDSERFKKSKQARESARARAALRKNSALDETISHADGNTVLKGRAAQRKDSAREETISHADGNTALQDRVAQRKDSACAETITLARKCHLRKLRVLPGKELFSLAQAYNNPHRDPGFGYLRESDFHQHPQVFLQRISVAYLVHCESDYHEQLAMIRGRIGADEATKILRKRILALIAKAYSWLNKKYLYSKRVWGTAPRKKAKRQAAQAVKTRKTARPKSAGRS